MFKNMKNPSHKIYFFSKIIPVLHKLLNILSCLSLNHLGIPSINLKYYFTLNIKGLISTIMHPKPNKFKFIHVLCENQQISFINNKE